MTFQTSSPNQSLIGTVGIVAVAAAVALAIVLALTFATLTKVMFALSAIIIFVPVFFVREPRAYCLFLLVLFMPVDMEFQVTRWLVEPQDLYHQFGLPASGTASIGFFIPDIVLIAMMLPWLGQMWLGGHRFYFPKAGYIFVVYLVWSVSVSLVRAPSLYLSVFELIREIFYLTLLLYLANNVVTDSQFRAVLMGLFIALAIEAGAVIVFFVLGVGSEYNFFSDLLYGAASRPETTGTLTVAESGAWKNVARSAGLFAHPSHAAYYFEYTLPIVGGFALVARRLRDRILFASLLAIGCIALLLTFSRSGMLGFLTAATVFFPIARRGGLISRRMFASFVVIAVVAATLATPLLIAFLESRPDAFDTRFQLLDPALDAFWQRPIAGIGLNNASAVIEGSVAVTQVTATSFDYTMTIVHNFYLVLLIDVGIVGFVLFFWFFGQTALIALRHLPAADTEAKICLSGILASWIGLCVHNFGDPFGGHAVQSMLYLSAGLTFAVCRRTHIQSARPATRSIVPAGPPRIGPSPITAVHSR